MWDFLLGIGLPALLLWWTVTGLKRSLAHGGNRTVLLLVAGVKFVVLWVVLYVALGYLHDSGVAKFTKTHATPLTTADATSILSADMNGCNPGFSDLCAYIDLANWPDGRIIAPDLFGRITGSRSHVDPTTHERVVDGTSTSIVPIGAMARVARLYDAPIGFDQDSASARLNGGTGAVNPLRQCPTEKPCFSGGAFVAVPLFSTAVTVTNLVPYADDKDVRIAHWSATLAPTTEGERLASVSDQARDRVQKYAGKTLSGWTEMRYLDKTSGQYAEKFHGWYSIAEFDPRVGQIYDQPATFRQTLRWVLIILVVIVGALIYGGLGLLGFHKGGGNDYHGSAGLDNVGDHLR